MVTGVIKLSQIFVKTLTACKTARKILRLAPA